MRRATASRGLWRHPDFLRLWAGQTISQFGSQVTLLALPLTADLTLGATPAEMGLLDALQTVPYLLVGLPAGVWVDRLPRRPVLMVADLGRGALLGTLPAAASLHRLGLPQLYLVAFATGLGDATGLAVAGGAIEPDTGLARMRAAAPARAAPRW